MYDIVVNSSKIVTHDTQDILSVIPNAKYYIILSSGMPNLFFIGCDQEDVLLFIPRSSLLDKKYVTCSVNIQIYNSNIPMLYSCVPEPLSYSSDSFLIISKTHQFNVYSYRYIHDISIPIRIILPCFEKIRNVSYIDLSSMDDRYKEQYILTNYIFHGKSHGLQYTKNVVMMNTEHVVYTHTKLYGLELSPLDIALILENYIDIHRMSYEKTKLMVELIKNQYNIPFIQLLIRLCDVLNRSDILEGLYANVNINKDCCTEISKQDSLILYRLFSYDKNIYDTCSIPDFITGNRYLRSLNEYIDYLFIKHGYMSYECPCIVCKTSRIII